MHQNISFLRLIYMQPSNRLKKSIISSIAHVEYRRAKIYLLISSSVFVASLAGIILSLKYITNSFYQSGFYEYLSLLFVGNSVILEYWKELSYSLAETTPIIGIISFLTTSGFCIWSGVSTITNTRRLILKTF